MYALQTLATRLQTELSQNNVFDDTGQVAFPEKLHQLLNLSYVKIMVCDVEQWHIYYINEALAERFSEESGLISLEKQMALQQLFEPATAMHFNHVHNLYFNKSISPVSGAIAMPSESGTIYAESYASVLATNQTGKATYFAHLIIEPDDVPLMNAHVLYDMNKLTPRQKETFQLLLTGEASSIIANKMDISEKTLEKHMKAIFELTGSHSQIELINSCSSTI